MAMSLGELRMTQVASPTSNLRAAQAMLKGTKILVAADAPDIPVGLLAGQCLEVALKAYLLSTGMTEDDFKPSKKGVSHSIADAWRLCIDRGLPLDVTLSHWAAHLHGGQQSPFMFRYVKDNTAIVLPPRSVLVEGLRGVLSAVQAATGVT